MCIRDRVERRLDESPTAVYWKRREAYVCKCSAAPLEKNIETGRIAGGVAALPAAYKRHFADTAGGKLSLIHI